MNPKRSLLLGAAFFSFLIAANPALAQGTQITYQGRLNDTGVPANGSYDLTFSLYTVSVGGVVAPGTAPLTNSPVLISNGMFTVKLDFGPGVFNGATYWLQIGTRTNGGGAFVDLTPRQELTPGPYAIYAETAPIANNAVTSAKILDGTITAADLGSNSVNTTHIVDGQVFNADLANDAVNSAKVLNGSLVGADLANNTVTSVQLADNIVLGDSGTTGQLDIFRNSLGTESIRLLGGTSQISTYGSDGLEQIRLWGPSYGELLLNNSLANNATAVKLTAQGSTGGLLELRNTNGVNRATLEGENAGGLLTLMTADGNTGAALYGNEGSGSGALSLRNTNGNPRLRAFGGPASGSIALYDADGTQTFLAQGAEASSGSQLLMYENDGSLGLQLDAEQGSGGGGFIGVYEGDGTAAIIADSDSQGGAIAVYEEDGTLTTLIHNVSDSGVVSVRNSVGNETVYLWGEESDGTGDGQIGLKKSSGTETITMQAGEGATGAQILMRNAAGVQTIQMDSDASGVACGYLQLYRSDGTATITLNADTAGDGRITTQELQITGGSDLSEQFDVNPAQEALQPGMVVCIDPQHPGELVSSTKAYDRTVAGVISGAGGVKPGMMMGQIGTKADGKHPVALTGRVYVLADASWESIVPGDLLTTSSTPGHAMKVTDHNQAGGAVLGKAMTGLSEGKGMVLILVTLQ